MPRTRRRNGTGFGGRRARDARSPPTAGPLRSRDARSPPTAGPLRSRAVFVHALRVRYGECDLQGLVFNANYLAYYDVAFTELWREAIGPWQAMVERGVEIVVAEAALSFRAPARFDDVIDFRIRVVRLGTTSFGTEFEVVR